MWSFLYGQNHGKVELILDNAPARSAELLALDRVDAALVPVIAFQTIPDVRLIPDVCVGAKERVRSVCLVTKGEALNDVKSVALDVSSRTSVVLTKIIFREFLGFEPEWIEARPNIDEMLKTADAALLIGDPALSIAECGMWNANSSEPLAIATGFFDPKSKIQDPKSYDLAELWNQHTGLGFVFAMWMTRRDEISIDFAAARDEGLAHMDEIATNYSSEIGLSRDQMSTYLTENISFSVDASMRRGMELYFDLAERHGYIERSIPVRFT